ncbi:MAG: DNA polymerase III subunit delta' [Syntrophales bacterium]|nr:DNA polymerase III subunit delta' [Syntrophales bacterium]
MVYHHIYGHEKQIAFLKHVVSTKKIAHAYVFCGPEGIGKRTVALSFAASLLCPSSEEGAGCGHCSTCERTMKGSHPDTVIISPTVATIKIQDIRDAIMATTLHPLEGLRRVVIIDEADHMSEPAANAILKTLEEPRPGNFFLLITARPYRLPPTIISRSQLIAFSPLARSQLTRFLLDQTKLSREQAEIIAACTDGRISKALSLANDEYFSFREEMHHALTSAIKSKALAPLILSRFISQEKMELEDKLTVLTTLFRDALWLKETGSTEGIANVDFLEIIRILAHQLSPRQILLNIQTLTQAQLDLELNANKSLTLDASLFSLSFP